MRSLNIISLIKSVLKKPNETKPTPLMQDSGGKPTGGEPSSYPDPELVQRLPGARLPQVNCACSCPWPVSYCVGLKGISCRLFAFLISFI